MDLAQLITELKPLCEHPRRHWDDIVALLDRSAELAEYEVARFLVARAVGGDVESSLRSPDPRERLRGVQAVRLTYPRAEASRVLRAVVKDADAMVRAQARFAVRQLGLDDVALPDTRFQIPSWVRRVTPRTVGAWNPTGWGFGTKGVRRATRDDVFRRYGLPVLRTGHDVAMLCGLDSDEELPRLARPGTGPGAPYIEFEIAKASGGTRRIWAPRHELKRVQRVLLDRLLAPLPVHPACHGFVAGRSTVSNAAPHQGARLIIKTDLRDFFPSVHYRRVQGLFEHYGYNSVVAGLLAGLTTHRPVMDDGQVAWPGVLPQGAPTSPALANLVCRRLDTRLHGLATKLGARYTRYADDLTFSFGSASEVEGGVGRFHWWVDQICQQEGFVENTAKRRVLRPSAQQRVTGVVVNDGLHVPRKERRRFRAILANCRAHGVASQARGREDFVEYLRGFAAYVKMVQPDLGVRLVAEVEEILAGAPGGQGGHGDGAR